MFFLRIHFRVAINHQVQIMLNIIIDVEQCQTLGPVAHRRVSKVSFQALPGSFTLGVLQL
uniref:Uncharacterized protein n=1 Tax=Anguilla anguilla TaxID=7936 RepID=A0A0E9WQY4_ANGAN